MKNYLLFMIFAYYFYRIDKTKDLKEAKFIGGVSIAMYLAEIGMRIFEQWGF